MKEIQIEFFQDKKSIHWLGGQPCASETYYCMKDNFEVVASPLKEEVYKYLKDDENIIVMNVSTFKKLQEKLKTFQEDEIKEIVE
jgi:hypothetical protein